MSYSLFKVIQPPTGVEVAIKAHVIKETELNLVIAKTSFLQIFRIANENFESEVSSDGKQEHSVRPTLELVYERKMFGNIESIHALRLPGSERDSLVMSFRDAKVSIVEFDPAIQDFRVSSLHFFEDEKYKEGKMKYQSQPILQVDLQNRCGVMVIYDKWLAVIPFKTRSLLDDEDMDLEGGNEDKTPRSWVINLNEMGIRNVKDYVFLDGYYEPTLLILHEPTMTWTGRLSYVKDTCRLSAISLDLTQQSHPVVWSVDRLPYDCSYLVSVPEPLGGAIVMSTNMLLYYNQNNRYGLIVNDTIPEEYLESPFALERSSTKLTLDCSHSVFLDKSKLLVSLKGGELFLFSFVADARTIKSTVLSKVGSSAIASCVGNVFPLISALSNIFESVLLGLSCGRLVVDFVHHKTLNSFKCQRK